MKIGYPLMLFALFGCIGVFIWWIRGERAHAILFSDERSFISPPQWMLYLWRMAQGALLCAFILGTCALARPLGSIRESRIYEKMHQGCLVVDISSSMNSTEDSITQATRIQVVVKAAKEFVEKRRGDQMCMVPFGSSVQLGLTISPTTDVESLQKGLDVLIQNVEGSTAMGDGMFFAFTMFLSDMLDRNERLDIVSLQKEITEIKNGKKEGLSYINDLMSRGAMLHDMYMLVLTDGEYNTGAVDPLALLFVLRRFGFRVYILGVGEGFVANEQLVHLVKETGGDVLFAGDVNETSIFLEKINQLQKRNVLTEIMYKQKELAPLAMRIALGCIVFFFSVYMILRGGIGFSLFARKT